MRGGDVLTVDFGIPIGSEAGFVRPAVVISEDDAFGVVTVVPFTTTVRNWGSEVSTPYGAAQCWLVTTISRSSVVAELGSVSTVELAQIREVVAIILGFE